MKPQTGFTLIELMITVAVAAVLMGVAMPVLSGLVFRTPLSTTTNELVSQLALARSEAVSSGRETVLCGSTDGFSCDGRWERGFAIWTDNNRNGTADANEFVRFFEQPSNVLLTASVAEVAFDARGRRIGADPAFRLEHQQCSERRRLANTVAVTTPGRASMRAADCARRAQ